MTHPQLKWVQGKFNTIAPGAGFRDITMLSFWGSVIIEANTTGFAMEFLGDMNDSQAVPMNKTCWMNTITADKLTDCAQTPDYNTMSTGPNLQ